VLRPAAVDLVGCSKLKNTVVQYYADEATAAASWNGQAAWFSTALLGTKLCSTFLLVELMFLCMQPKKKTKTVIEKYWDWELSNETQPIWVRFIFFLFIDIIMIVYACIFGNVNVWALCGEFACVPLCVCLQHQYCVLAKKVEPYGIFLCCLQLRNPKEVSTEEYNDFFKKTFNEYLGPLASSHFTTEVHVLIYIGCLLFFVLVIQWLLLWWLA
jgi:hypothetical protein